MEQVTIQVLLTAVNLLCAAWMYSEKKYKVAMFNCFAAGVCFMGIFNAL